MFGFDSWIPLAAKASAMFQVLVVSIDLRLSAYGFDLATIITRGLTPVIVGIVLTVTTGIIRQAKHQMTERFVLMVERTQPNFKEGTKCKTTINNWGAFSLVEKRSP